MAPIRAGWPASQLGLKAKNPSVWLGPNRIPSYSAQGCDEGNATGYLIVWILVFITLVIARGVITDLTDWAARPIARALNLSSSQPLLRYVPSAALMVAGIAILIAAPLPWRFTGALLTVFTAIVIYRQWTWNEETFARIQYRTAAGSPDRLHDLIWLNLLGAVMLVPGFGLLYGVLAKTGVHFKMPAESLVHSLAHS